jgi:callose synthase
LRDAETPHVFVATALNAAKKSYLEKRSWFHLFLNFRRVYEFLILTFQLLAVVGFSQLLVWDAAFTIQALSSVFLTANLLQVVWTCMLAWVQLPPKELPSLDPAAAAGLLLALAARYTVLVFQCLYFTWAMDRLHPLSAPLRQHAVASGALGAASSADAEAAFWWWQYAWLSALALSGYAVEALVQLVPAWASAVLTGGSGATASAAASGAGGRTSDAAAAAAAAAGARRSDWLAALLHVNFPLSRSYVGKEVVESWANAFVYQGFWLSLLAFKFAFGYLFLVQPMCGPTIELYDDLVTRTRARQQAEWYSAPRAVTCHVDTSMWTPVFHLFFSLCHRSTTRRRTSFG